MSAASRLVLSLALALTAALPAMAETTEIPCSQTNLEIKLPGAKCVRVESEGPDFIWTNVFNDQYISQTRTTIESYYYAESGASFAKGIKQFNSVTEKATDWSPVAQHKNAWVTTFASNGRRCLAFSNYGPPRYFGYAWTSTGFACDPNTANAGKPFTPVDYDAALRIVTPK